MSAAYTRVFTVVVADITIVKFLLFRYVKELLYHKSVMLLNRCNSFSTCEDY